MTRTSSPPSKARGTWRHAFRTARFEELTPGCHVPIDIIDPLADAVLAFVVGEREKAVSTDRVLATVLFTDIVGSTESVTAEGDDRWRRTLDVHQEIVDRHLSRPAVAR